MPAQIPPKHGFAALTDEVEEDSDTKSNLDPTTSTDSEYDPRNSWMMLLQT